MTASSVAPYYHRSMSSMKQIRTFIDRLSRLVDAEKFRTALRIYEKRAPAFLRSRIDQRDRTALLSLGAEIYHFNQMYGDSSACLSEIERLGDNIISSMKYIETKFHSICVTGSIDTAFEFINSAISKSRSEVDRQRLDINDVTGYIDIMNDLGIEISKDTWLAVAGLSAALSGQLWNSLYGAYRYIVHGERAIRNIEFGSVTGLRIALPNFYLFPTVRGLYLETETYLRGLFYPGDLVFVSFGSGLDYLGIEKTGPVDRMRIGATYHPAGRFHWFGVSPFLYLDFTGGMKQIGHSVGVVVETRSYRRFFLTATIEHNRGDMIEQTIKFKDDGFFFIAGLGFRL